MAQPSSSEQAQAQESENITSLIIRSIPQKYEVTDLLAELIHFGAKGNLDFLHVPWNDASPTNLGFGIVNLTSAEAARQVMQSMNGKTWKFSESKKAVRILPARMQGFEANVLHAATAASLRPRRLPLTFDRGHPIPFKMAVDIVLQDKERRRERRRELRQEERRLARRQMFEQMQELQAILADFEVRVKSLLEAKCSVAGSGNTQGSALGLLDHLQNRLQDLWKQVDPQQRHATDQTSTEKLQKEVAADAEQVQQLVEAAKPVKSSAKDSSSDKKDVGRRLELNQEQRQFEQQEQLQYQLKQLNLLQTQLQCLQTWQQQRFDLENLHHRHRHQPGHQGKKQSEAALDQELEHCLEQHVKARDESAAKLQAQASSLEAPSQTTSQQQQEQQQQQQQQLQQQQQHQQQQQQQQSPPPPPPPPPTSSNQGQGSASTQWEHQHSQTHLHSQCPPQQEAQQHQQQLPASLTQPQGTGVPTSTSTTMTLSRVLPSGLLFAGGDKSEVAAAKSSDKLHALQSTAADTRHFGSNSSSSNSNSNGKINNSGNLNSSSNNHKTSANNNSNSSNSNSSNSNSNSNSSMHGHSCAHWQAQGVQQAYRWTGSCEPLRLVHQLDGQQTLSHALPDSQMVHYHQPDWQQQQRVQLEQSYHEQHNELWQQYQLQLMQLQHPSTTPFDAPQELRWQSLPNPVSTGSMQAPLPAPTWGGVCSGQDGPSFYVDVLPLQDFRDMPAIHPISEAAFAQASRQVEDLLVQLLG